jgi:hypothetical protein
MHARRGPIARGHYISGRAVHSLLVIVRIGRGGDLAPLGARSQYQHNEERDEPSVPVHRFLRAHPI